MPGEHDPRWDYTIDIIDGLYREYFNPRSSVAERKTLQELYTRVPTKHKIGKALFLKGAVGLDLALHAETIKDKRGVTSEALLGRVEGFFGAVIEESTDKRQDTIRRCLASVYTAYLPPFKEFVRSRRPSVTTMESTYESLRSSSVYFTDQLAAAAGGDAVREDRAARLVAVHENHLLAVRGVIAANGTVSTWPSMLYRQPPPFVSSSHAAQWDGAVSAVGFFKHHESTKFLAVPGTLTREISRRIVPMPSLENGIGQTEVGEVVRLAQQEVLAPDLAARTAATERLAVLGKNFFATLGWNWE